MKIIEPLNMNSEYKVLWSKYVKLDTRKRQLEELLDACMERDRGKGSVKSTDVQKMVDDPDGQEDWSELPSTSTVRVRLRTASQAVDTVKLELGALVARLTDDVGRQVAPEVVRKVDALRRARVAAEQAKLELRKFHQELWSLGWKLQNPENNWTWYEKRVNPPV
jgi:hypothetical protein